MEAPGMVTELAAPALLRHSMAGMSARRTAPAAALLAALVAVAPQGAQTEIILYLPDENWEHYKGVVGKSQALTLDVGDMADVHENLKGKGVTFIQEPDVQPWGTFAIIQDSEGNHLILVEQPA